ncbi:signal peptidase II [Microbacterium aoyamense]|uniref:signal peptidase II n=1 Tax=Microbacterium aoyamense TaxID=344166 RepID=UPI00200445C7|nr:signal peptidase II [Microbacterium aoyamense]
MAAVAILIDQATKAAALSALSETDRIRLVGDLLGLQLAFNPGAILSLGSGVTWLLTLLGVGAVVLILIATTRARTAITAVALGLILGGAVGNLIDRLFAPPAFGRGHVVDFLAYGDLFIGNLADVALGAGVILLLIDTFRRRRTASQSVDDARSEAQSTIEVEK